MVASFFGMGAHIATIPLEDHRTVPADWRTSICLPEVLERLCEKCPGAGLRGLHLHHDIASAHTADAATLDILAENGVQLVSSTLFARPGSLRLVPVSIYQMQAVWDPL